MELHKLLCILVVLTPLHEASLSQFGRDEYTSDRKYYKVNLMLTEVPSGIPADAVEVHIERNNISRVEANAFSQLSLCQVLDLTGNEISVVELSAFDGLTSLTDLWLSRNQIPEIKPGTFDGLTGLIMLDLSWNRLERLYVNMFANLENIKLLRISGNQISEIEQESFCGLRNLVELHLSENKLSILRADMFQGLVALTELYISYNRIKSVQYNTNMEPFIELTYLQAIDLEGNHLEHLPADVFRHLSRPLTLGVESNPLKCDADLCWLKEEELQGGTEWYRGHARYHESKPACNGDKNWDLWNCNDTAGSEETTQSSSEKAFLSTTYATTVAASTSRCPKRTTEKKIKDCRKWIMVGIVSLVIIFALTIIVVCVKRLSKLNCLALFYAR